MHQFVAVKAQRQEGTEPSPLLCHRSVIHTNSSDITYLTIISYAPEHWPCYRYTLLQPKVPPACLEILKEGLALFGARLANRHASSTLTYTYPHSLRPPSHTPHSLPMSMQYDGVHLHLPFRPFPMREIIAALGPVFNGTNGTTHSHYILLLSILLLQSALLTIVFHSHLPVRSDRSCKGDGDDVSRRGVTVDR